MQPSRIVVLNGVFGKSHEEVMKEDGCIQSTVLSGRILDVAGHLAASDENFVQGGPTPASARPLVPLEYTH